MNSNVVVILWKNFIKMQTKNIARLEEELDVSKKYLEAIFDNNPNMMIISDGQTIEQMNKSVLEFTGYKDINSFKSEHDCICDLFVHEKDTCLEATMADLAWNEYILLRPEETHTVCMFKENKLHSFHIIMSEIVIDAKKHFLLVFNDITYNHSLEQKLLESKKMFDSFMDNIPYVIVIKNENLIVEYENSVAKYYRHHQDVGHSAVENLGYKLSVKINALSKKAQREGKAEGVLEYFHDGKKYIFRALAFAIPQEDEKVYVGVIYIDITKERQLSDELKEKEELMIAQSHHAAMGEMISMIAHQWRQPISVIAMDANNILVDIELEAYNMESLKSDVNDIVLQTQHLSKTIDDFRDFFKPHKLKDRLLISEVFEETLQVIDKSFANNNISIENEFQTDTQIEIFSRELLQVFLNILKNAKEELIQNRSGERKIQNKIYEDEDNIIIQITDNSGGINMNIIDKIFDPYFSTKDEKNGTGLGLYMSKVIVQKHLYGTLDVHNTTDGACFTITLPKISGE